MSVCMYYSSDILLAAPCVFEEAGKIKVLLQLEAAAMFYAVQTEPRVDCLVKIAN